MGYYTNFKLTLIDAKTENEIEPESKIYKAIKETFMKVFGEKDTGDYTYFDELVEYGNNWKWYDWNEDMETMAELFPDVYFTLEGEGEDREDWWIADFHGNQSCIRRAEITPPENMPMIWKEN